MAVIGSAARRRMGMAWAVANALQLVFTVAWTVGGMPVAGLLHLLARDERPPLRMAARWWAPGLLRGAGARLHVEGLERVDWSRPVVLVANHQSMIDVCVLFRAVPVPLRFMLKQELAKVPLIGWYARRMGMVFIERGRSRNLPGRLRDAEALLRKGAVLCAFPEGTRSRDGSVGAFKGGAFQVAIEAGVPVVPVAITGAGSVLPAAGFRVRPGTIRLSFGAPLATDGLGADDRNALAQRARAAVVELMAACRSDVAGAPGATAPPRASPST